MLAAAVRLSGLSPANLGGRQLRCGRGPARRRPVPVSPVSGIVPESGTINATGTKETGRGGTGRPSAGDEVLGLGMVADEGGGRLLGLVLPARLLAHVDAEPVGAEQPGDRGVVLQVRAGGVT